MLKTLFALLGETSPVLRRYLALAVVYGLLCGLALTALVPVVGALLTGDMSAARTWLAVLLAGMAACWALRGVVERAGVRVGVALLQDARHRLGDHVARLPAGWFTPQNTARLGHVMTQGMMSIAQLPAHVLTPVISGVVTPAVLLAALFWLHAPLGLIGLAALPLTAALMGLTRRLARRADSLYQQRFADASQRVVEFAQAQALLRAFNGEGGSTRWLTETFERQQQAGGRLIWLSAGSSVLTMWGVQAVFAVMLFAVVTWAGAAPQGGLPGESAGVVIALLLAARFIDSLLEVASYGDVLRGATGQLDEVQVILAAAPLPAPATPRVPHDAGIELRNVHFGYDDDGPDVLHDVSLRIAPGTMTALIGESGSGKTTLVRLIARFFDVYQGSVLVGGVDVRDMTEPQLAAQISQIFQESFLFSGTIADNVRLGRPDADDAQIVAALCEAGAESLLLRWPQGLDTPVGEGGARLSAGERQRVAIARALIKNAPILLVDEATAALDAESQAVIAQALARLRGRRTLVVIAHQLATVAMADQIVVLERGAVVEQGTLAQLATSQGHYAHFLEQRRMAKRWRVVTPRGARS